jgi:hypothetical protein
LSFDSDRALTGGFERREGVTCARDELMQFESEEAAVGGRMVRCAINFRKTRD